MYYIAINTVTVMISANCGPGRSLQDGGIACVQSLRSTLHCAPHNELVDTLYEAG
jgi:hypothetical protein